jgi:RNA recognition motif-containing protein
MSTKLYVGNLPYNTTQEELSELFGKHGEVVEVALITDRETGRSKGFGFVTMADAAAAQQAIQRLNGTSLNNRTLTVNEARPREERRWWLSWRRRQRPSFEQPLVVSAWRSRHDC